MSNSGKVTCVSCFPDSCCHVATLFPFPFLLHKYQIFGVQEEGEGEGFTRMAYLILVSSERVGMVLAMHHYFTKKCFEFIGKVQRYYGLGYIRCHMHFCLEHSVHLINIY